MHADTTLTLGTESGLERDPDVTINNSYEGLEGGTVYIYSGRYYVVASDDGVNAAGGSSNGSNPGGGGDPFNPGGGWPGGGGQPGGGSSSSGDYNIYIYGGDLYVNCDGDGLDSNGGLYLYGGTQAVFSMKSGGDNSALDSDGTTLIQGATVFTAGTKGVDGTAKSSWFGTNQKYSTSTTSYTSGKIINTKAGSSGSVMFSYSLPKNVNYILASWPSSTSNSTPSFTTASSVTSCLGGSWSHSWNSGVVTTAACTTSEGVMTYTCTKCGETETCTIPKTVQIDECDHSVEIETVDEGYTVTFAGDEGVSFITVYLTQDYTGESEYVSATGATVSRNSASGEPDSTGDGQVNFTVVLKDGYEINTVSATSGAYKNIKGPSDTGVENTYRITKVKKDLTVTVTTSIVETETSYISIDAETSTVLDKDNGIMYGFSVLPTCEEDILNSIIVTEDGVTVEIVPTENGFGTGTIINVIVNDEIVDSYTVIIFGDATGDGIIDESDFVMIDLYNAMLYFPDEDSPEFLGMDCNRDGVVDESDIVLVDLTNAFMGEIDQVNGGIIFY